VLVSIFQLVLDPIVAKTMNYLG